MKTVKIKTRPTIYLSDIHGDIDSLGLLNTFLKDYPADKYNLVFGGDYIDGDPGGFKCLYFVKNMQDTRDNTYVLKGNHEQMLINYLQMPDELNKRQYYMNGGKHTLRAALGTGASAEVMASAIRGTFPELVKWLYKLPTAVYDDHKLCVHAGIDWGAEPWFNTDDTHAIWTRDAYIYNDAQDDGLDYHTKGFHPNTSGKVIITGHTPTYFFDYDQKCPIYQVGNFGYHELPRYFIDGGEHGLNHSFNVLVTDKDGVGTAYKVGVDVARTEEKGYKETPIHRTEIQNY